MNVRLVLMRKRKRIWTAQLKQPEVTLGRAHGCTIRIPSAEVSRLHCRLRLEDGLVTVEDLESVNGTFVNDARIHDPEIVHPGDRLTLGTLTFVVEYELPTETLRPLGSEDAEPANQQTEPPGEDQETKADVDVDVEVLEDSGSKPAVKPPPTEEFEVVDVETIPLAEQEELHISDSDHLRDFLIELDQADSHPGE